LQAQAVVVTRPELGVPMQRTLPRFLPVALSLMTLAAPLAAQADDALARANRLLRSAILIDGHNDLPWEVRRSDPPMDVEGYDLRARTRGHTDLERLAADRRQRLRPGPARAVRHCAPHHRALSRAPRLRVERRRRRARAPHREDRLAPRHGGRARYR
jgi:hypothetical protein